MINWNDIRVEQEIAQARYQVIVHERTARELLELSQDMRARQLTSNQKDSTSFPVRVLSWLRRRLPPREATYGMKALTDRLIQR